MPQSFLDDLAAGKEEATMLVQHMDDVECVVRCLMPGDAAAATAAYWHDAQKIRGWDDGWNVVQRNGPRSEIDDVVWANTVEAHRDPTTWAPDQFAGTRIGDLITGHHQNWVHVTDPALNALRIGDAISTQARRAYMGVKTWSEAYDIVVAGNGLWAPKPFFQGMLDPQMLADPRLRGLLR